MIPRFDCDSAEVPKCLPEADCPETERTESDIGKHIVFPDLKVLLSLESWRSVKQPLVFTLHGEKRALTTFRAPLKVLKNNSRLSIVKGHLVCTHHGAKPQRPLEIGGKRSGDTKSRVKAARALQMRVS